jgi:hypothetical protein
VRNKENNDYTDMKNDIESKSNLAKSSERESRKKSFREILIKLGNTKITGKE